MNTAVSCHLAQKVRRRHSPPSVGPLHGTLREQSGEEALIFIRDRHLDCAIAVGVDPVSRIIRVTTAVELKGWRGRLYFGVVRPVHPMVVDSMLKRHTRSKNTPR